MNELRKKLEDLQETLPMDLKKFVASVKLPEDEDCFEFSYFKTFINLMNLYVKEGAKIEVYKNKEKTHYHKMMGQKFSLEDPNNEENTCDVVIERFSSGDGWHHFVEISYDGKSFFIDRRDGKKLDLSILV